MSSVLSVVFSAVLLKVYLINYRLSINTVS